MACLWGERTLDQLAGMSLNENWLGATEFVRAIALVLQDGP